MKSRSGLLSAALVALILGLAPILSAYAQPGNAAVPMVQLAGHSAGRPASALVNTPSPLLRPLRPGFLLAIPTATPTPALLLRPLRAGILNSAVIDAMLRAAPTPPPVSELQIWSPATIGSFSQIVIGPKLRYIESVNPDRLSALGLEVAQTGGQQQLQVVSPDHLKLLKVLAADAIGALGQPPPYLECGSAIDLTAFGNVLTGAISETVPACAYTFSGKAGDHVQLSAESTDFTPWLDLFDPSGVYLEPATDDPSQDGHARFRSYVLSADGAYTVVVRPVEEGAAGSFQLTVSPLRTMLLMASIKLCMRNVTLDQTISDEVLLPGTKCFFSFPAAAGNRVTIAMDSPDGQIDPVLELNDPDDLVEAENDDAGPGVRNSLIAAHEIRRDGLYTIVAHAYAGTQGGKFNLTLAAAAPPTPAPAPTPSLCGGRIRYGQTLGSDSLAFAGAECRYRFSGTRGDVITITMTHGDGPLDPFVTLLDPAGGFLASDDDGAGNRNSRIGSFRLNQTGEFTIVAGSYRGRSTGPFALSLSK